MGWRIILATTCSKMVAGIPRQAVPWGGSLEVMNETHFGSEGDECLNPGFGHLLVIGPWPIYSNPLSLSFISLVKWDHSTYFILLL